jgi:hypothetical protein
MLNNVNYMKKISKMVISAWVVFKLGQSINAHGLDSHSDLFPWNKYIYLLYTIML